MEEKPKKKSLVELLNEVEESEDEYSCYHCGFVSNTNFSVCPQCKKRVENPTMEEWGKQLAIGVEQEDKTFARDFDLEPIDWNREREINKRWGAKKGNMSLSEYIGTILASTVTRIAGQDITKFKFHKKLLIFNQMYQADIFYMYAYLRLITLGNEMNLGQINCMGCGHQFPFTADLSSLEVVVITNPDDLLTEIELKNGFEMNGDVKSRIWVKPPLWNMMDSGFPTNLNDADMFLAMLSNCVVRIEGMPEGAVMTEREVSQFTKFDVEHCEEAMEVVLAGPRWEIEGECPKCNATFYDLIDWSYDRFFALSSRSRRRKRRSRRLSR